MPVVNALSIDLEDWYQGLTSTSRRLEEWSQFQDRILKSTPPLLDILCKLNVLATFFVLGHVAQAHPQLIEEIQARGHEIATHGHRHRLVYEMSPCEFRRDVQYSIDVLQDITGVPVYGHRAPAFSIDQRTPWALGILEDLGLRYDSSIVPTRNPLYGWRGAPRFAYRVPSTRSLIEIPVATLKLWKWTVPVGGGFYTRAFPLLLTKWAIKRINAQGQPAVLYFHPWEFDPSHPRPSTVTMRERVSHYHNLDKTEARLCNLLQTFRFAPLIQLLENTQSEQWRFDKGSVVPESESMLLVR